jgi:hypothetical protein
MEGEAHAQARLCRLGNTHYEHDLRNDGPMAGATEALVERISQGRTPRSHMPVLAEAMVLGNKVVAEITRRSS